MSVPLGFFIAAWSYALCVNFVDYYRIPADKLGLATIGLKKTGIDEEGIKGEPEKVDVDHTEKSSEEVEEVSKR